MSEETRGKLLHSQLQQGLRYSIMEAPAVSGSVIDHGLAANLSSMYLLKVLVQLYLCSGGR